MSATNNHMSGFQLRLESCNPGFGMVHLSGNNHERINITEVFEGWLDLLTFDAAI
jgi:hypothetical protein